MSPEMLLLTVLGVINFLLLLVIAYSAGKSLELAVEELDSRLADALQSLVTEFTQGGFAGIEPPNPIQIAISQLIAGWAEQQKQIIPAQVVERSDNGQFKSQNVD